jgi:hypothetical protein
VFRAYRQLCYPLEGRITFRRLSPKTGEFAHFIAFASNSKAFFLLTQHDITKEQSLVKLMHNSLQDRRLARDAVRIMTRQRK